MTSLTQPLVFGICCLAAAFLLTRQRFELYRHTLATFGILCVICHVVATNVSGQVQDSTSAAPKPRELIRPVLRVAQISGAKPPAPPRSPAARTPASSGPAFIPVAGVDRGIPPILGDDGVSSSTRGSFVPPALPGAGGGEMRFFGEVPIGNVVYIIDRSGSMESDSRLERVKAEVSRLIDQQAEGSRIAAIFFSGGGEPDRWVPEGNVPNYLEANATADEKAQFRKDLQAIEPSGSTEPRSALERALSMNPPPDEIYLLTDGEFKWTDESARWLKDNSNGIPIHGTFVGKDKSTSLERIVKDSDGQATNVP